MPPVAADMLPMVLQALDLSDAVLAVVERTADAAGGLLLRQVNGAFCRAFAADYAALEGLPLTALAAPDQTEKLALLTAAAARGAPHRDELVCLRPNGSRLWLGLTLMPASGPGRPDNLFVLLARDITKLRQEAQQQSAVQRLLATVFAAAEAGLAIVGHDGRFLMTNACHDRMLGHEPGSLTGRMASELLAPESREPVRLARTQQLADGKRYEIDVTLLAADGALLPATLVSGVVSSGDLERYRVVTVLSRGPAVRPQGPRHIPLTGKIRLISLDDVKAVLGQRWEAMVERVMEAAERIVARRMAPGDTFFRTKDHGFVVCFPGASEDEATFRAAALAREIRHRLIGTGEDPETVEISAVVAELPPGTKPGSQSDAAIERHMADVELQLRAEAQLGPDAGSFLFEQVIGPEHGPLLGHYIRAEWPRRSVTGGVIALPIGRLESDIGALHFAQRVAVDAPDSSERLFIEIDFDCFYSRPKSQALIDACRDLGPATRARVVLLLAGLPETVAKAQVLEQSRVLDSVQRLRPFCRAVGFVLDTPDLHGADTVITAGTFVLLNAHAWDRTRALAHARITKLAAGLRARRSSLMVRGIESVSGRASLRDCGVSLFVVVNAPE